MRKTMLFDGKETEFSSSGATPILYKQCFKQDLLKTSIDLRNNKDKNDKELTMLDMIKQLAYIMYCEANYKDVFNRLTFESYVKWLMDLSPNAFDDTDTNLAIIQLWRGNSAGTSEPKN